MIAETTQRQVVIFTGRGASPSTIELIETISQSFPHWHFTIFQEIKPRRLGPYFRSKIRRLGREPFSYLLELFGWRARSPRSTCAASSRRWASAWSTIRSAPTAEPLDSNSGHGSRRIAGVDLRALGSLELLDSEGELQRLGELWNDRPVVLVFLRHFG